MVGQDAQKEKSKKLNCLFLRTFPFRHIAPSETPAVSLTFVNLNPSPLNFQPLSNFSAIIT